MTSGQKFQTELFAPFESIKDSSLLKVRVISVALLTGHLSYYWIWAFVYPQPYESPLWRGAGVALGGLSLYASMRYGVADRRTAWAYGLATAYGCVFIAAWFYVGNGGNAVWLASLCAMLMLYFTLTDWRVALLVTTGSLLFAGLVGPWSGVGVWGAGGGQETFSGPSTLIILFAIGTSLISRISDISVRAVRMRSQMRALAITAHEIRTPLASLQLLSTALNGQLDNVIAGTPVAQSQLDAMRGLCCDVVAGIDDANAMIGTHLANANPFKPFSHRSPVQISDVVHETVMLFQRGTGAREPLVTIDVEQDFTVLGDRGVVKQVLLNLLSNSLKAVVRKHRIAAPGQITVRVMCAQQEGILAVADRGAGITKAEMPNIFKPFHTGDPDHGHGLGLTFVESVANAYCATVGVETAENLGTTITLSFRNATPI